MKKFNFKKIGILLAMMLVAGAALVGPVSAGSSTLYQYPYEVKATGEYYSYPNGIQYLGSVEEVNGNYGSMEITVQLHNVDVYQSPKTASTSNNWQVSTGWHTYYDPNPVSTGTYVRATFNAGGQSGTTTYTL
ncbi:hypothetical protein F1737_05905 [Methanoplanus sp. FWC-SCC4]|uniref:Uncharacterized protein n=1 Tax=Methanochimaera problematica TaxID=2609417 RepID=A0AA97FDJ1_9EURY|nr:hypothetical protein [Methanoplanus sp. FWC-SCC4]WOF16278.1 hypothetical protein F1737_05905 [Methanoplanus sp. FWC-SCC4]